MEFCEKCGTMMMPFTQEDGSNVLKCRSCGHIKEIERPLKLSEEIGRGPRDKIVVVEDDSIPMPVTKASCPKCDNTDAYYWTLQTRRGDEGATEFYRCTKCKHTWRNYGG